MNQTVKQCPEWLLKQEGVTQRQWKSRKRQELKRILLAVDRYSMGCAYCPGVNGEVGSIRELLRSLKKSHSVKEWGR